MKVGPVSADLLLKLALLAAGVGLAVYVYRRTVGAASAAAVAIAQQAGEVYDAVIVGVNPANPSNWVNQAVTAAGSAVLSDTAPGRNADGSWTVGGWLYDVTHADPVRQAGTGSGQAAVFDPVSNEPTDWSQLSSLGAP